MSSDGKEAKKETKEKKKKDEFAELDFDRISNTDMSVLHSPCLERFMDIALDFGTGKTYPMFSFELAMRSLCYAREFFSEGRRPENGAKLDLSSSMAIIKQYGFEVDVDAFFRELVGGDHHDNKWKRLMPLDWGRLVLADRLELWWLRRPHEEILTLPVVARMVEANADFLNMEDCPKFLVRLCGQDQKSYLDHEWMVLKKPAWIHHLQVKFPQLVCFIYEKTSKRVSQHRKKDGPFHLTTDDLNYIVRVQQIRLKDVLRDLPLREIIALRDSPHALDGLLKKHFAAEFLESGLENDKTTVFGDTKMPYWVMDHRGGKCVCRLCSAHFKSEFYDDGDEDDGPMTSPYHAGSPRHHDYSPTSPSYPPTSPNYDPRAD